MKMKKRLVLAAAVSAFFAVAAHAEVTELVIYKDSNFRGASQTIKGEVARLENGFDGQASSAIARGGAWEVCTGDHFKGNCRVLPEGDHRELQGLNDRIVSVRFLGNDPRYSRRDERDDRPAGREDRRVGRQARGAIELYGQEGFRGRSLRIDDNVPDLAEQSFDGRASSVIVRAGTWQMCTEPGFGGRCAVFKPGEYSQLATLDDRVSSVRQVR